MILAHEYEQQVLCQPARAQSYRGGGSLCARSDCLPVIMALCFVLFLALMLLWCLSCVLADNWHISLFQNFFFLFKFSVSDVEEAWSPLWNHPIKQQQKCPVSDLLSIDVMSSALTSMSFCLPLVPSRRMNMLCPKSLAVSVDGNLFLQIWR